MFKHSRTHLLSLIGSLGIFLVFSGAVSHAEMDEMQARSLIAAHEAKTKVKADASQKDTNSKPVSLKDAPQYLKDEDVVKEPVEVDAGSSNSHDYKVGTDDELRVLVYGEPELSKKYTVSSVGTVSMPLIGDVYVRGLTVSEIEDRVEHALADGYLIKPSVSIEISEYRPFYILGEVREPGSYSFVNDMTVLNAAALAGGFTYRADRKHVEVLRTTDGQTDAVKKHPVEEQILPGDIILVKERFF